MRSMSEHETDLFGAPVPANPTFVAVVKKMPKFLGAGETETTYRPYHVIKRNRNECWVINDDAAHLFR